MRAAVGGFEDSALRATRHEFPRRSVRMPDGGVNDFRIRRIENQVECTSGITAEERLLPRLPAIDRFENAALRIWPEDVTERRHVNDVRILWIDSHAPDLPAFGESDVLPRFAGVSGF